MGTQTPPERVVAAMPGTLMELAERTGYDPAIVLKLIVRARVDGVRVNAVEQVRDPDHQATTIFVVDDFSRQE